MLQYMLLFLKEKQKETYQEKLSRKLILKPLPQNILSYFPLCANSIEKLTIRVSTKKATKQ